MISLILILIGVLGWIATGNIVVHIVFLTLAVITAVLKQAYHGYLISSNGEDKHVENRR